MRHLYRYIVFGSLFLAHELDVWLRSIFQLDMTPTLWFAVWLESIIAIPMFWWVVQMFFYTPTEKDLKIIRPRYKRMKCPLTRVYEATHTTCKECPDQCDRYKSVFIPKS